MEKRVDFLAWKGLEWRDPEWHPVKGCEIGQGFLKHGGIGYERHDNLRGFEAGSTLGRGHGAGNSQGHGSHYGAGRG